MKEDFFKLLNNFVEREPEIVFEWSDPYSEARGWVVINSLRGGAAGGGTRMRKGLDRHEVISLAKTMEIKFTVSGPHIGGAKSGIDFDPQDSRKNAVLARWYKAVSPLLKFYYGTGGDLNIDERAEVIPLTEDAGIWHPQEGVFKGHFKPTEAQMVHRIGQLRQGVVKIIEDPRFTPDIFKRYTVADMITGYGVAEAVKHYYDIWGGNIDNKKIVIQGWGNVGAAAGYYLSQMGGKIIGISDAEGAIFNRNGYTKKEIKDLFTNRKTNMLNVPDKTVHNEFYDLLDREKYQVFIPAASSRLVSGDQVKAMINSGVEVISCGANVPFQDKEIFFGPTGLFADENISVIPDFIANCGMARVFAYLMQDVINLNDENIFFDTSMRIKEALRDTFNANPTKTGLAATAFTRALSLLV